MTEQERQERWDTARENYARWKATQAEQAQARWDRSLARVDDTLRREAGAEDSEAASVPTHPDDTDRSNQ